MSDDCDKIKFIAPEDSFGGPRKVPSCVPLPDRIPDELIQPALPAPEPEPIITPAPLVLGNDEQFAPCEGGSLGDGVTIAENVITREFYWNTILTIDRMVLSNINNLPNYDFIYDAYRDGTLTPDVIIERTGMHHSDAVLVVAEINSIKESLNQAALTLAQQELPASCYWLNEKIVVECPDPDMATEADHPDARFSITVQAGVFKSFVSQADANEQARIAAENALVCFYTNDPIEADCTTRPNKPLPVMEPVPNDLVPVAEGLKLRVGTFRIRAGVFKSEISKGHANAMAEAEAYRSLECFYVNDPMTFQCDDPDARDEGVLPSEPPVVGSVNPPSTGQIISIPIGFVTSELSTEDANREAKAIAENLLVCCFVNKEIFLECPPVPLNDEFGNPVLDANGQQVYIQANKGASPGYSIHIPEGTFTSCISQEEADALAQNETIGALICFYCNTAVLPKCVPNWVIAGIIAGEISLPLNPDSLIDPETGVKPNYSDWSVDATVGVPADVYCAEDYYQAQGVANGNSNITLDETRDVRATCHFTNDETVVACAAVDPYTGLEAVGIVKGINPNTMEAYQFYSKFPSVSCINSAFSSPEKGNYITIEAGSISATALEVPGTLPENDPNYDSDYNDRLTKNFANQKAMDLAQAIISCIFTNPDTIGVCTGGSATDNCDGPWRVGLDKSPKNLTNFSNTEISPFFLPQGTIQSQESIDDVREKTRTFIEQLIICKYYNERQEVFCADPEQQQAGGVAEEGVFNNANSLQEANKQALLFAQSTISCITGGMGEQGPPGKDGSPGRPGSDGRDANCEGTCYGVYS